MTNTKMTNTTITLADERHALAVTLAATPALIAVSDLADSRSADRRMFDSSDRFVLPAIPAGTVRISIPSLNGCPAYEVGRVGGVWYEFDENGQQWTRTLDTTGLPNDE